MKLRAFLYSVIATIILIGCDDDLNSVGMGIQPDEDRINIFRDTISFTSSTQILDSIYTKVYRKEAGAYGLLGSFNDPTYGNVDYGYLCSFYTIPDSLFIDEASDKIDSVILRITYNSYVGDSLTTMEASAYAITQGKNLKKHFYSNVDPWEYTNTDSLWSRTPYSTRNLLIPDSIHSSYLSYIKIKVPNYVGQRIYDQWKDPSKRNLFKDPDEFVKFFPGVYIESSYGSGSIINVYQTQLEIWYTCFYEEEETNENGETITVTKTKATYRSFPASEDVTQLNKFKSKKEDDMKLVEDLTRTYLKTPAGVVTQLEIPLQKIADIVGENRLFNNISLTLEAEEQPSWDYTLSVPPKVLLISPDSVNVFFEEARLANSSYSYYADLSTNLFYNFGNISNLIRTSIDNLKEQGLPQDEWPTLKLWVIPVSTPSLDGYNTSITTHYLTPSGAILKTGPENLKLYITTTLPNTRK